MSMKNILTAALGLFLFAACNKEVEELPPATQTGAHTFGAKVDGELWVPKGFGGFPANDILEAKFTGANSIMIRAKNFAKSPKETEFEIHLINVTGPGTYTLNVDVVRPTVSASYAYFVERELTPKNEWQTTPSYTGTVTITRLDLVNEIISGTFQFNAINLYNSPEPLSVTEGRFDIKML
jgi:hypothetical protein